MNLGRAANLVHIRRPKLPYVVMGSFLAVAGSVIQNSHARADVPSWYNECGLEASSSSGSGPIGCAADSAEFVVKFLFVSFPNVLDALEVGEQPLPTWADSVVTDLMDYIEFMSVGRVTLDASIEKRPGADSLFYWVTDLDSDDVCPEYWDVFNLLPPDGWNDGVDLVVYVQADQVCGQSAPPQNKGAMCGSPAEAYENNWIRHFTGYLQASPLDWLPFTRNKFETILIHEVGHSFHTHDSTGHMPSGANGEAPGCSGPYFSCFGSAMNTRPDVACMEEDGETTKNNGLNPYHPFSMIRQGFLHPDTISTTTYDVVLGDVRLYPNEGVFIPLTQGGHQGFVLTNHQLTGYDKVLGERGMAIWHYAYVPYAECFAQETWILDLELALPRFRRHIGYSVVCMTSYCSSYSIGLR